MPTCRPSPPRGRDSCLPHHLSTLAAPPSRAARQAQRRHGRPTAAPQPHPRRYFADGRRRHSRRRTFLRSRRRYVARDGDVAPLAVAVGHEQPNAQPPRPRSTSTFADVDSYGQRRSAPRLGRWLHRPRRLQRHRRSRGPWAIGTRVHCQLGTTTSTRQPRARDRRNRSSPSSHAPDHR